MILRYMPIQSIINNKERYQPQHTFYHRRVLQYYLGRPAAAVVAHAVIRRLATLSMKMATFRFRLPISLLL